MRPPEDLARGAAEGAEKGSVFLGVFDAEGESATKTQIPKGTTLNQSERM